MTVNELIEQLQSFSHSADLTVRISAFGHIGGDPAVDNVSMGFDWNHGSLVLSTKQPLQMYKKAKKRK